MLTYAVAKIKPKPFLTLTSVHVEEFEYLLTHFAPRSDRYFRYYTWQGKKRKYPRFVSNPMSRWPTWRTNSFSCRIGL